MDVTVGTLSKAFGCLGGFAACSRGLKQLLLNRGRSYVYSTSLPLPVVEAAGAALAVSGRCGPPSPLPSPLAPGLGPPLRYDRATQEEPGPPLPTRFSPPAPPPSSEPWRRRHVWSLVARLRDGLGVPALSPVVPLVVGGEAAALRLQASAGLGRGVRAGSGAEGLRCGSWATAAGRAVRGVRRRRAPQLLPASPPAPPPGLPTAPGHPRARHPPAYCASRHLPVGG